MGEGNTAASEGALQESNPCKPVVIPVVYHKLAQLHANAQVNTAKMQMFNLDGVHSGATFEVGTAPDFSVTAPTIFQFKSSETLENLTPHPRT